MKGIITIAAAVLSAAAFAGPRIATEAWVSNYVAKVAASSEVIDGKNVYSAGPVKMIVEPSTEPALVVIEQTQESIDAGITNGMIFAASPATHSYVNGNLSIAATATKLTFNFDGYEYHSFMLRGACWLVRDLEIANSQDSTRRRVAFCKLASTKIQPAKAAELLGE